MKRRMSEGDQNEALLIDIKNYLDITYEDEDTNKKLTGIISRGISYLNRMAGTSLDFQTEDEPRELLFDYCRYARSNALESFETNFKSRLISLRLGREVEYHGTIGVSDV